MCIRGYLNIWKLNLPSPNYQCWWNIFHAPKPRKGYHGSVAQNSQNPNKIDLETLLTKFYTIYKDWNKDEVKVKEKNSTSEIRWSHSSYAKKPLCRKTLWQAKNVNGISKNVLRV